MRPGGVNDVTHQKRGLRFEKSQWSWVDFRSLPRPCGGCRTWFGADGKVVIKRLCLPLPHVEKPFNSKVIKSFIPELRSRKYFLCFGIPMLSIYELWTFYVHFMYPYIWVCYRRALLLSCYDVNENLYFDLHLESDYLY